MTNWYEGDAKIKRTMGIFMEMTKQQVIMRAGGFFSLTLNTFTQVVKFNFIHLTDFTSFFFMLDFFVISE